MWIEADKIAVQDMNAKRPKELKAAIPPIRVEQGV